jgi:phosphoglycerate dehydrogenase-like enzyme
MAMLRVMCVSKISTLPAALQQVLAKTSFGSRVELMVRTPEALFGSTGEEASVEWREMTLLVADPGLVVQHLDKAVNLKWMQSTWAGVEKVFSTTQKRDYKLTRLGGCFGQQMAEYAIAHILSFERRLPEARSQQLDTVWKQEPFQSCRKVSSLTLSILGCGDIGLVVARYAAAMGMRVIALRRSRVAEEQDEVPSFGPAIEYTDDIDHALREADYIVNILPSTPATRGLLDDAMLERCIKSPVFINVGRGDIADEATLLRALDSSPPRLSGLVLDVFPVEPLPTTSKLWSHPRCVVTPHSAALSFAEDVAVLFADNLVRYEAGDDLKFCIQWTQGY